MEKQKKLLAAIQAAERAALEVYNSGVKIAGVVQKLRAAAEELGARVRSLEREVAVPPAHQVKGVKVAAPPANTSQN